MAMCKTQISGVKKCTGDPKIIINTNKTRTLNGSMHSLFIELRCGVTRKQILIKERVGKTCEVGLHAKSP